VISVSVAHAPPTHIHRPHINPWLVAVVALSAGLVALGTLTIIDRSTESEPAAAQIVDDLNAAVNAGDAEAVRALFTPDAVFQMPTGETITGLDNVVNAALIPHAVRFQIERVGPVAIAGNSAASFTKVSGTGGHGTRRSPVRGREDRANVGLQRGLQVGRP
jgi:uncharacterized protein (TIGR02246 family)